MAVAALDRLRDRWDRLAPRERTLLMALAGTAVVCVVAFLAIMIRDGLSSMKERNEDRREAIETLETYRLAEAERRAEGAPEVAVPDEPLELRVYLNGIAGQTGIDIPGYSMRRPERDGPFRRHSTQIEIDEVSMYDLAEFLERVEGESEIVVIWDLDLSQNFRDRDKLDVEMTVSTFERVQDEGEDESED